MYYEIPVTIFNENGDPSFEVYYAKGSFSEVSQAVDDFLSIRFPSYDYELVESTEDLYNSVSPESIINIEKTSEEAVLDRDIYDDMEDLQDRYYELMDRLNSIPISSNMKSFNVQKQISDAQFHLNESKEYFDQYDFQACKDTLDQAEKTIDFIQKGQIKKISNEQFSKRAIEEIESTPDITQKFSLLGEAVRVENESILYYQNLLQEHSEWSDVLQDIIDEELKHVGQFEDLRNRLTPNIGQKIAEGEEEGKEQMLKQTKASEEAFISDDEDFYDENLLKEIKNINSSLYSHLIRKRSNWPDLKISKIFGDEAYWDDGERQVMPYDSKSTNPFYKVNGKVLGTYFNFNGLDVLLPGDLSNLSEDEAFNVFMQNRDSISRNWKKFVSGGGEEFLKKWEEINGSSGFDFTEYDENERKDREFWEEVDRKLPRIPELVDFGMRETLSMGFREYEWPHNWRRDFNQPAIEISTNRPDKAYVRMFNAPTDFNETTSFDEAIKIAKNFISKYRR